MAATATTGTGVDVTSRLAEYKAELGLLLEPVIPGVRADIRHAAETLVTDIEYLASRTA